MTTDKHAPVPCPACGGKGKTSHYSSYGRGPERDLCSFCLGHGTVHPLKCRQYEANQEVAALARITHQKRAN